MQSDEKRTYKPNRPCARMTNCPSVSPSGTIKFLRGLYIIHFDIIIIFNEPRASRHLVEEMRIKNFHKGDDLAIRTPALCERRSKAVVDGGTSSVTKMK